MEKPNADFAFAKFSTAFYDAASHPRMIDISSLSRRHFLKQCAGGVVAMAARPDALKAAEQKPQPAGKPASPLAMWALTGTLKSEDVRRQLDAFHFAGWGAVLYPRWGLELEYLGDAWFERIRFIVEQAATASFGFIWRSLVPVCIDELRH